VTRISTARLYEMKATGEKIVSLTAYDASFATVLDEAGVEVILVGDSLGMVLHGEDSTLNVTMEDMIYHTRHVVKGSKRAMIIGDMPHKSYLNPEHQQYLRDDSTYCCPRYFRVCPPGFNPAVPRRAGRL